MIDTSKMTDAAFIRTLRMRYRAAEQPAITADEVRRLLNIASELRMDSPLHYSGVLSRSGVTAAAP